ncbi:MAG: sodium ion-translocating decarboxylase subunit beta [Clostridia bacterium]|nr:sodium ion-translocating decarboxylase subunit beta [Clostridia bacterium]
MDFLIEGITNITLPMVAMWLIGAALIYLGIAKKMEPALLIGLGFGAILVNLPLSGAINQIMGDNLQVNGIVEWLFDVGIKASEALPLLLFIGIGAMIDFGPLLSSPKLFLFGAAAQFGIFITLFIAGFFFPLKDAASISIIGAADGPTAILVSQILKSQYMGAIAVAAYSYMALVPIIQPPIIKLITTKAERQIRMPYNPKNVSRTTKLLFPVLVTIIAGLIAPASVALIGFIMFGNLLRECGVLPSISKTASNEFSNIITLLLGLTISFSMKAENFIRWDTLLIMCLGLFAFVFDTVGGVMFAKLLNVFSKNKINPIIGAAGISAFPMAARVAQRMALSEDPENHILMHAVGANIAGQIGSVVAGGVVLSMIARML